MFGLSPVLQLDRGQGQRNFTGKEIPHNCNCLIFPTHTQFYDSYLFNENNYPPHIVENEFKRFEKYKQLNVEMLPNPNKIFVNSIH